MMFKNVAPERGYCMPTNDFPDGITDLAAFGYDKEGNRIRLELMQYTGIKDKSGVEIYEGDIVRVKSRFDSVVGPVTYKDTGFGFNVPTTSEYEEKFRSLGTGWYGVEVIGNVHENPELLE
jgi:uncharacterized phage protein (TIGR01671 family)